MPQHRESLEDRISLAGKHPAFVTMVRGVEAGTVDEGEAYDLLTQEFGADPEEASEFLDMLTGAE